MAVESHQFEVATRGGSEVLDLTDQVAAAVSKGRIIDGLVTVFVVGSTAAITTTEFEPGLANHDLKAAFEKIAPDERSTSTKRPGTTTTATPTSGRRWSAPAWPSRWSA